MSKIIYIAVDKTTKEIKSCGSCNCQMTFDAQPSPDNCELIEFVGGVKGLYFVDGDMQAEKP